jgi:parvulin-like peptidyl-prolyl isomerase
MKKVLLLLSLLTGSAVADPTPPVEVDVLSPAAPAREDPRVERAREEVLVAAVERRFVTSQVRVSDPEVESYLAAHRAELAGSERIILRHLFRRLSVRAPESEREAARAELAALREEILAGADLAALAQARSDSQSARFGGLIAPQARGQLEPSVEARVWRLAVGELSEVVETPIGLHIFRLEQRLPPKEVDPATARAIGRRQLTFTAAAAARERFFDQLLRESGALWAPQRLEPPTAPGALLFELGRERWTVGDLDQAAAELPFLAQRTALPIDLLRERARRVLYLDKAGRARLAEEIEVARDLAEAERSARLEDAVEAGLAERRSRLSDADLRPLYDARPERFAQPARRRLRILVRAFTPAHSPHYYFEELQALAAEIRAGRRDFAAAARELSSDRSAAVGGDLGWIDLRDLGWWAGTRAFEQVGKLSPGATSEPLLVEVYDAERLTDVSRGYMLVRVEEVQPRRTRTFDEARADVAAAWIADHLPALRQEIEAGLEPSGVVPR